MTKLSPLRHSAVRWRRWLILGVTVLLGSLTGLLVLEPLSRPAGINSVQSPERHGQGGPASHSSGFPSSQGSAVPITAEQLTIEAKQVAARLVTQFPDNPHALTLAGSVYHAFGEQAAADRCWEKSLSIDPDLAPTSQRMGEAAWERGEYDLAVSHLRRAVAADPSSASQLAFLLADSLMNLGSTEEAISVLEQAARQDALSLDAVFLLGHGYLQLGQYHKARDQFMAGLSIEPASSKIHFGLATVYARLGQLEDSRKHREQYAKLKFQKLDETVDQRASLRGMDLGDMRPFAVRTYVNAGKIHASQDDIRRAEAYWFRAFEIDPRNPEPRSWLELLYTQEGRQEEAARIRQVGSSAQNPPKELHDE